MQESLKMKVHLITNTADPLATIAAAARLCYSPKDIIGVLEDAWDEEGPAGNRRVVKRCMDSGHTSVIEHASIVFGVEGMSRACSHQLVRHRIASYSQQSQRYVKFDKGAVDDLPIIVPPSIKPAL